MSVANGPCVFCRTVDMETFLLVRRLPLKDLLIKVSRMTIKLRVLNSSGRLVTNTTQPNGKTRNSEQEVGSATC